MKRRTFLQSMAGGLMVASGTAATDPTRSASPGITLPVADNNQIRLFLAGDVMLGRGIDQVLPHPSTPRLFESYVKDARQYVRLAEGKNGKIPAPVDYGYVWGDSLAILGSFRPHVRIVNLETSVTTSDDYWPSKGINYRMHPGNVACLSVAGIDCCVLANNHVLDWGYAGLEETLTTLGNADISAVGAGSNLDEASRPARFPVDGKGEVLVFGLAAKSSGVPEAWRASQDRTGIYLVNEPTLAAAERVVKGIKAYSKPDDIVIVSIHWGGNWGYEVTSGQRRFAEYLVENGDVTVVHGHSSHHPRPVQLFNDKAIIYGCGDFVNDYEGIGGYEQYRPWLSAMYLVTIDVDSRQLERLEIVPLQMRRFQLTEVSADDRRWLQNQLNEVSERFNTVFEAEGNRLAAYRHDKQSASQSS